MRKLWVVLGMGLLICMGAQGQVGEVQRGSEENRHNPYDQLKTLIEEIYKKGGTADVPGWIEVEFADNQPPKLKVFPQYEKHVRLESTLDSLYRAYIQLEFMAKDLEEQVFSLEFQSERMKEVLDVAIAGKDSLESQLEQIRSDHERLQMAYDVILLEEYSAEGKTDPEASAFIFEEKVRGNMESFDDESSILTLSSTPKEGWGIQIAAFINLEKAKDMAKEFALENTDLPIYIFQKYSKGAKYFAVVYGCLSDRTIAQAFLKRMRGMEDDPFVASDAFLVNYP